MVGQSLTPINCAKREPCTGALFTIFVPMTELLLIMKNAAWSSKSPLMMLKQSNILMQFCNPTWHTFFGTREKVDIESASPRCAKGRKNPNLSAVDGGKIFPLLPFCDTEIVIKLNKMSKSILYRVWHNFLRVNLTSCKGRWLMTNIVELWDELNYEFWKNSRLEVV